jgi:hypothetical protein
MTGLTISTRASALSILICAGACGSGTVVGAGADAEAAAPIMHPRRTSTSGAMAGIASMSQMMGTYWTTGQFNTVAVRVEAHIVVQRTCDTIYGI